MLWAVVAAAFGLYAWTAAPAAGWLDSAEFAAASVGLGVPHPPGHPLPVLIGKLSALVPLGDAVFRVNLASALAGAAAAGALYVVAAKVARAAAPAPALSQRAVQGVAAAMALAYAAGGAAWEQSVRAEVYALEAALVLVGVALALDWLSGQAPPAGGPFMPRGSDTRALYAAALAFGLALANHHFVTLTVLVPLAAVALLARPSVKTAARTAAFGLLGLLAFAYLPLRALRHPEVDWGDPHTLGRFLWVVSAKAFHKTVGHPSVLSDELVATLQAFGAELLAVGLFAAAGAVVLARRRPALAVTLLAVAGCGVAGRAILGFDPDNPDAYGYLLPALAATTALGAAGLAALLAALRGPARQGTVAAAVLAALAAAQLVRYTGQSSLRGAYAADAYARGVLDPLPPRALLVTSYYETAFGVWAQQVVAGERPDVTLVDRNLLTHPGADEVVRARHPELAALVDAPLRGGRPTPTGALAAIAAERPVAFELAINLDERDPALPHLVPDGAIAWYRPEPPTPEARAAAETADAAHAEALARALASPVRADRLGAARVLVWNAYLDARFYCATHRAAAARAAIARARDRSANPGDEDLAELERRCAAAAP